MPDYTTVTYVTAKSLFVGTVIVDKSIAVANVLQRLEGYLVEQRLNATKIPIRAD